jgi:hypothetical protein
MVMAEEHAWRRGAEPVPQRCDDTGEHYGTVMLPRLGAGLRCDGEQREERDGPGDPWRPVPSICPRCEAPDDRPHYPGCAFYDPGEAALFAGQLAEAGADVTTVLRQIEARARTLDPQAWRPYLTAGEFTEIFPAVPYVAADDLGVSPADLAAAAQLDPGHAEEVLARQAEHREYVAQRAAAFALDRGRQLSAWRAIGTATQEYVS